jgi:putative colanic acid biosynthesis acetyltransferase WcaF
LIAAEYKTHGISARGASPWTLRQKVGLLLWELVWTFFCSWTPKPCNAWRLFWLRLFGCRIRGVPFVHQRARIQIPWKVTLEDRCSVGDRANLYSLDEIKLGPQSTVAQEAYLCTGTHDFDDPKKDLLTLPISVGEDGFVGARAFLMPGVEVGARAIVGACSLVTKSVPAGAVVMGSPAALVRFR